MNPQTTTTTMIIAMTTTTTIPITIPMTMMALEKFAGTPMCYFSLGGWKRLRENMGLLQLLISIDP